MAGADESRGATVDEVEARRLVDAVNESSIAMSLCPSSSSSSTSIESDLLLLSVMLMLEGTGDGLAVATEEAIVSFELTAKKSGWEAR